MRKLAFLTLLALAGCYLKQWPVTSKMVEASSFVLLSSDGYQATGWAVAEHSVITAGHMCEPDHGVSAPQITAIQGTRRIPAHVVAWDIPGSYADPAPPDVCLLSVDLSLTPLILADEMPAPGAAVTALGFVHDVFGFDEVVATGSYLGDTHVSVPFQHGMSGGAVFSPSGVIGIVSRGLTAEENHGTAVWVICTVAQIKDLLDRAHVSYHYPPLPLPDDFPATSDPG